MPDVKNLAVKLTSFQNGRALLDADFTADSKLFLKNDDHLDLDFVEFLL